MMLRKHSCLSDRTHRSAQAFRFGLLAAVKEEELQDEGVHGLRPYPEASVVGGSDRVRRRRHPCPVSGGRIVATYGGVGLGKDAFPVIRLMMPWAYTMSDSTLFGSMSVTVERWMDYVVVAIEDSRFSWWRGSSAFCESCCVSSESVLFF
jgi:hypothetical protein